MSMSVSEVIQLVNGVLADPGTSSKDHVAVVAKAIALHKEVEFQVKRENDKEKPAAVAPSKK